MMIKLCDLPYEVNGEHKHRLWLYPGEPITAAPGVFVMLMNPVTNGQAHPTLHLQSLTHGVMSAPLADGLYLETRDGSRYGIVPRAVEGGEDGRVNKAFIEVVKISNELAAKARQVLP